MTQDEVMDDVLERSGWSVPCDACYTEYVQPATWIVYFTIPEPPFWFMCVDCKTRWIAHGFGTVYDVGSRWVRL